MFHQFVKVLLIFLVIFSACKNNSSNSNEEPQAEVDTIKQVTPEEELLKTEVFVWVDKLRLRSESTTSSDIVATLEEGQALEYLEERSDFTEKITLRGTQFDEPWLKVKTSSGEEGWVYGGGVKFYRIGTDQVETPYDDCFELQKDRRWQQAQKCIDRTQYRQLKQTTRVQNENGNLRIRLDNKKLLEYAANRDTQYHFYYAIDGVAAFVISRTTNLSEEFFLINQKNGQQTPVIGFPKPNKNQAADYIAALQPDWKDRRGRTGIQILQYDGGFTTVFEEEMTDYRPILPKWIDDQTLQFTILEKDDTRHRKTLTSQLTLTKDGWTLEL